VELTDGCYSGGDSQGLPGFIHPRVLGIPTISFQLKTLLSNETVQKFRGPNPSILQKNFVHFRIVFYAWKMQMCVEDADGRCRWRTRLPQQLHSLKQSCNTKNERHRVYCQVHFTSPGHGERSRNPRFDLIS